MTDWLDNIIGDQPVAAPPAAGGDWLDGILGEARTPASPAGVTRRLPGVAGGVDMIAQWVQQNPRAAAEMLVQGGVATAGAIAGAPAGPVGMAAGGAAGNVAGRGVAHDVTRWMGLHNEPPMGAGDLVSPQAGLDAVVGGAPALLPNVARAIGIPIGRAATGTSGRAGMDTLRRQEVDLIEGATAGRNFRGPAVGQGAEITDEAFASIQAYERALRRAESMAGRATDVVRAGAVGGAAIDVVTSMDPVRAMAILGIGHGLSQVQRRIAEKALMSEAVVAGLQRRIADISFAGMTRDQIGRRIGTEIMAVAAEHGLREGPDPEQTLGGSRVGQRRNPFDVVMTPQGAEIGRDRMTGRFVTLGE